MSQKIVNPSLADLYPFSSQDLASAESNNTIQALVKQLPGFTEILFSDPLLVDEINDGESCQQGPKFTALDRLGARESSSSQNQASQEEALKIVMQPNQDILTSNLLKCIEVVSFPVRIIQTIKSFSTSYWEAHRTCESGEFDQKKVLFFANMLIAVFEIKSLAVQELITDKELEIFNMNEEQLNRFSSKLTEKFVNQCVKTSENQEILWEKVIEKLEGPTASIIRRKFINLHEISLTSLESIEVSEELGDGPIIKEKQKLNDHFDLLTEKEKEPTWPVANENGNEECNPECFNLSTVTEGQVTDIDTSLPALPNESCDDRAQRTNVEVNKKEEAEKQAEKEGEKQAEKEAEKETEKEAEKEAEKQAEKEGKKETEKEAEAIA